MNSSRQTLQDLQSLTPAQKANLKRGNLKDVSDLILSAPSELSKKLKISLSEVLSIVHSACEELAPRSTFRSLAEGYNVDVFSTGDANLDDAIGGGIRTGMLWELVGESASGKTQLALQLSLLVQLPQNLGGLSGAACYLTTHSMLPTKRLTQLCANHPLLSSSTCGLSDIHTCSIPTPEILMRSLAETLPALQSELLSKPERKPIRLVIIDSIAALFHSTEKSTSQTLFDRSRALSELSKSIHTIASQCNIAFLVINEVSDVFKHPRDLGEDSQNSEIIYSDQARWFNCAHSIPRENRKEAVLGLVWANQVNARIMFTRTSRRRYLEERDSMSKRPRLEENGVGPRREIREDSRQAAQADEAVLIRRLSVVFNSTSVPASVDFIISERGLFVVDDEFLSPAMPSSLPVSSSTPSDMSRRAPGTSSGQESVQSPPVESLHDGHVNLAFSDPPEQGDNLSSSLLGEGDPLQEPGPDYWDGFDEVPYDARAEDDFDEVDAVNAESDT